MEDLIKTLRDKSLSGAVNTGEAERLIRLAYARGAKLGMSLDYVVTENPNTVRCLKFIDSEINNLLSLEDVESKEFKIKLPAVAQPVKERIMHIEEDEKKENLWTRFIKYMNQHSVGEVIYQEDIKEQMQAKDGTISVYKLSLMQLGFLVSEGRGKCSLTKEIPLNTKMLPPKKVAA